MARMAVGAVNITRTSWSATTRQNAPASGVRTGLLAGLDSVFGFGFAADFTSALEGEAGLAVGLTVSAFFDLGVSWDVGDWGVGFFATVGLIAGSTIGAIDGMISGNLGDQILQHRFVREVGDLLDLDTSAICFHVLDNSWQDPPENVSQLINDEGGTLLRTTLSWLPNDLGLRSL